MAKKLNIELTVRRMEAQSILTTSGIGVSTQSVYDETEAGVAERGFHPYAGLAPIREGF